MYDYNIFTCYHRKDMSRQINRTISHYYIIEVQTAFSGIFNRLFWIRYLENFIVRCSSLIIYFCPIKHNSNNFSKEKRKKEIIGFKKFMTK